MSAHATLRRLWERVPRGRLARGAAATLVIKVVAMACTLLLQLGLVRMLGVGAYGEFIYVYTWFFSLLPLATLGLQEAGVRFAARYRALGEEARLQGFGRWSRRAALLSGLGTTAVALALTWGLRAQQSETLFAAFVVAWLVLPLATVGMIGATLLRGLERFTAAQVPLQIVLPLTTVALAALLVLGAGLPPEAPTAMLGFAGSMTLFFVTTRALARGAAGAGPQRSEVHGREWLAASLHFLGLSVVALVTRVDVLMLGALDGTVTAGMYATAVSVHLVVGFAFHILTFVVTPVISRLHSEDDHEELQRVLRAATAVATAIAAPGFALVLLLGRPILRLFDPSFDAAFDALAILAGSQLLLVVTGPVGRVLTMTGRHREALWFTGSGAVLNVLLNAALIPSFGMSGAAWATFLSMLAWRTLGLVYVWRELGTDPSLLSLLRRRP